MRKRGNDLHTASGGEPPQPVYSTQEDPIGLAGGMNLYGYAAGDPINFSDPFGLCPDSVQTEGGDCPGGLSTEEWESVESTYSCMSTEAAGRTRKLLFAGNIRGAALAPDDAGGVVPLIPNAIYINRTSSRGNIFFDSQLGPTLVHEWRHVDQFAGMSGQQAAQFYDENRILLELDAALYEGKNYTCARQP